MSTALTGAIGWAPQVDKTTPGSLANTKWHAGRMVNLALGELTQQFDQEIGGSLLPGGMMKLARWAEGDFECYPRTQEALGWLLYSLIGKVATTGGAAAGYTHKFPGAATRDNTIPNRWLTLRRITPADDPADYLGETFVACKVTSLTVTGAAGSVLTARFGFSGIEVGTVVMDPANAGSPWEVVTEDSEGVPVTPESNATFSDGTAFDALQQVAITIANQVQDARQELQVGSYARRNVTMLGRQVQISGTRFYDDPVMYRKIRYGAGTGTDWDKKIFFGGNQLSLVFKTQDDTLYGSNNDQQGEFGLTAKRVAWAAEPLTMQGGNPMALQVTGTVLKALGAESEDYQIVLKNDVASYAWPTAGAAPTVTTKTVDAGTGDTHVVLLLSAACEAGADPKRGFALIIDPTGAGAAAPEAILNAYFNDSTHLHLVVAHSFVNGDTATLAYDANEGCIVKTADGVPLATWTAATVTNNIP